MESYTIKEAAKMLSVETHVLRYWEEELGIEIKRNSMGHRFYDERDLKLFKDVQELKKRGLTLKDIKSGIDNKKKIEAMRKNTQENIKTDCVISQEECCAKAENACESDNQENTYSDDGKIVDFKVAQMQLAMNKIVANALRENKDIITTSIKAEITSDVMRQFDAVMREKEEKEEARFKKLDECLRQIQNVNAEVAATKMKKKFWKRK